MKQFSLPKKTVATIQLWSALLLVVLAFVFSLLPMVTINTENSRSDIESAAEKLFPDEPLGARIPEKIKLSVFDIFDSISLFAKIYQVDTGVEHAETVEEKNNVQAQIDEMSESLRTEKGIEDIVNTLSLYVIVTDALELDGSRELITMILAFSVAMIAVFFVVILTALYPFVMLILVVLAVIKALSNIKTPERAGPIISGRLIGCIPFILSFMLIQRVIPGMATGAGTTLVFITCILSALLNFVVSRLHTYPTEQFTYLNVLQATSLAGIIGFIMFFFGILNTNAFSNFIYGDIVSYVGSALALWAKGMNVNFGFATDIAMIYFAASLMFGVVGYLETLLRRFSCSPKRENKRRRKDVIDSFELRDNNPIKALICLVPYILISIVVSAKHLFNNPLSTETVGDASFLPLSGAEKGSLTVALIGLIIIILAEIAVIVLKIVFCKGLPKEERAAILAGVATELEVHAADEEKDDSDNSKEKSEDKKEKKDSEKSDKDEDKSEKKEDKKDDKDDESSKDEHKEEKEETHSEDSEDAPSEEKEDKE